MDKIRWYELPEARQLANLGKKLSKAAQQRLQWMLYYYFNGRNVARTCRHFGISRQTFYRWKRRFNRHDLTTLEGHSHRPRNVRQPTWTPQLVERVFALRKRYPHWGKDKLVMLLRRENRSVSTSMVGRILADLKRRGVLHEPPKRPPCGASSASCETARGPFASLNTGESSSPGIWWRSIPRKFVCGVASS